MTYRVWAPKPSKVELVRGEERTAMVRDEDGFWTTEVAADERDYAYSLDGGDPRPDPRSPWQPHGVHGASRMLDHDAFAWSDQHWRGLPLAGAVLYELHVGTFSPAGTFDGAVAHLDHLVGLGVDAVELLPCNAFAGERGWGYDGVEWFAVHEPYGGPEGLKRFVDACHVRGIGVVMDVVYNHLGPAGNYLPEFGPYLTEAHQTPWGPAVNLDRAGSDEVRRYIVDNALMWLRDYHLDGLRLDAVHALVDERATHVLEQVATEVTALSAQVGRPLFLIAESDLNDPRVVSSREAGGYGLDAQWTDDVHHALHANLTGETAGYYGDFATLGALAKALRSAFVHDGSWSSFRQRSHGRPVPAPLSGSHFVVYLQDHDQIGNRAVGDRLSATLSDGLLKTGAALLFTSACTPMLFMGEEWGARTPWQFFSDHEAELGAAVSRGRRAEFAQHGWSTRDIPDPQAVTTFHDSTLDWAELEGAREQDLLSWYRELIALRRRRPELTDGRRDLVEVTFKESARWLVLRRGGLVVACNLGPERQALPVPGTPSAALLASTSGFVYGPGQVEIDGGSVVLLEVL